MFVNKRQYPKEVRATTKKRSVRGMTVTCKQQYHQLVPKYGTVI